MCYYLYFVIKDYETNDPNSFTKYILFNFGCDKYFYCKPYFEISYIYLFAVLPGVSPFLHSIFIMSMRYYDYKSLYYQSKLSARTQSATAATTKQEARARLLEFHRISDSSNTQFSIQSSANIDLLRGMFYVGLDQLRMRVLR